MLVLTFRVTTDFDLLHQNSLCWKWPVAACVRYIGIPSVLTTNGKPCMKNATMSKWILAQRSWSVLNHILKLLWCGGLMLWITRSLCIILVDYENYTLNACVVMENIFNENLGNSNSNIFANKCLISVKFCLLLSFEGTCIYLVFIEFPFLSWRPDGAAFIVGVRHIIPRANIDKWFRETQIHYILVFIDKAVNMLCRNMFYWQSSAYFVKKTFLIWQSSE